MLLFVVLTTAKISATIPDCLNGYNHAGHVNDPQNASPAYLSGVTPRPLDNGTVVSTKPPSPLGNGTNVTPNHQTPQLSTIPEKQVPRPDLKAHLESKGYTDVTPVGEGSTADVYMGTGKDGRRYILKRQLATGPEDFLAADSYFLTRLQEAHEADAQKALAQGKPIPRSFFPERPEQITGPDGTTVLKMDFFPKNPDPTHPDHGKPAPTLEALIESGNITPEMEAKIISQLVDAVDYMGRHGVVHQDIKPANIIVNDKGEIKIIDFGLGAKVEEYTKATGYMPGKLVGTPAFMHPTQRDSVPGRTTFDVHALGKTLVALVTRGDRLNSDPGYAFTRLFAANTYVDYRGAPDHVMKNKGLAVAIADYHNTTPEKYKEGIEKALTLTPEKFLEWYGAQMKRDLSFVDEAGEVTRKLLSSRYLIENYPHGLKLSPVEQASVEAEVKKLRREARGFLEANGDPATTTINYQDTNPFLYFKEFDARVAPPAPR